MISLLKNRVFLLVLATDFLEDVGVWIRNMALLFFLMEKTGNDPIAVALLTVSEYAPVFLLSIIGGTLADRWNPKRTMITANVLSAISIAVILLLLVGGYWQGVFLATMVSAVVTQFSDPSSAKMYKRAIPPDQVETAIAVSQTISSLFIIIGPIIGTFFYVQWGVYACLTALIILYAASALVLLLLPAETDVQDMKGASFRSELKEGFQYIRSNRNLLLLFVSFAVMGLSAGLVQPIEVFLITDRLQLEKEQLQWFAVLAGVGMLAGGGLSAAMSKQMSKKTVLVVVNLFLAAATVVEAYSIWVWLTATMRFLAGVFLAFMQIVLGSLMMKWVEEKMTGRVNGIVTPLMTGSVLLGSILSGPLMAATSLITVFILAGAIMIGAAVACSRMRLEEENMQETRGC